LIAPARKADFLIYEKNHHLQTTYEAEYFKQMLGMADLVRNVAVIGPLHHGKTLLCDMVIQQTHKANNEAARWDLKRDYKFTDNRKDEVDRAISLKTSPVTVLLPDSREKSLLFNFMDTPGHPGFSDEVAASLRLADGAVLVVDCIEGMTFYLERLITDAIKTGTKFTVLLNKLDRLVLELKLPPSDAYYKLKHTLDDINGVI
jgi:116 kDa U5 small nuclear ribonucleoprotein component